MHHITEWEHPITLILLSVVAAASREGVVSSQMKHLQWKQKINNSNFPQLAMHHPHLKLIEIVSAVFLPYQLLQLRQTSFHFMFLSLVLEGEQKLQSSLSKWATKHKRQYEQAKTQKKKKTTFPNHPHSPSKTNKQKPTTIEKYQQYSRENPL